MAPRSRLLKHPEDVAIGVGDGGNQATAADIVSRLLHGGPRGGQLGQLGLDVRHLPEGDWEVMPCGPPPGTSPMCWPATS